MRKGIQFLVAQAQFFGLTVQVAEKRAFSMAIAAGAASVGKDAVSVGKFARPFVDQLQHAQHSIRRTQRHCQ